MSKNTAAKIDSGRNQQMARWAQMDQAALFKELKTSQFGLTAEQAGEKLEQYGPNAIAQRRPLPWIARLALSMVNPFNAVLTLIAITSFMVDVWFARPGQQSYATVIIILVMILASGILEFSAKQNGEKAAGALKSMVRTSAVALRGGIPADVRMEDLVPGDIVLLSAGHMLPADVRFIQCKDLFVGTATLTGESEPVEKTADTPKAVDSAIEASNLGYFGCDVISGNAVAVVLTTGNDTYLASIAKTLSSKRAQTSFERGVSDVSKLMMRMMAVMLPVIVVINGVVKHDWISALLFALSVSVGLTPELLPMILSTTLARGAMSMAKKKTIVKNPSAIQNFGAMDVLCTDKTGTLTENRIVLEKYLDIHGGTDMDVLEYAYFNSWYQTGLKNEIDLAIIRRAEAEGLSEKTADYKKVDEIPFDFKRRLMSVVLVDGDKKSRLITKGAIEEMLSISASCLYHGDVQPLTDEIRAEILALSGKLNDDGLRVLGLAYKDEVAAQGTFSAKDEADMVLIGFVAFLDEPKATAGQAIAALEAHGVRVVVLTGDNDRVTRAICARVGLKVDHIVLGADVERMDEGELQRTAKEVAVFAKLSPQQKARVVEALKAGGHTVGYMGDGINDASAMHASDVAISVDTAVDIARETADIVLTEKSLLVLEEGVREGRHTFGNVVKYIKMAASGNFGNMFSVLIASIFLPFLPMLPIQVLAQNLLYDCSQLAITADHVDAEYLDHPRRWSAGEIARFMFVLGPISSVFDVLTFLVLYFALGYRTPMQANLFQTGWFMMGLASQTMIVLMIRTNKLPFFRSRPATALILSTVAVIAAGLILPFTFVGTALGMARVSGSMYLWLIALLAGYALVVEYAKRIYIRRYGQWL